MDEIIYTTPEEQIEKLKSQNLMIEDEDNAKKVLALYGLNIPAPFEPLVRDLRATVPEGQSH